MKKLYLTIGILSMLVISTLTFFFVKDSLQPKTGHETLSYQGQTYYDTILLMPSTSNKPKVNDSLFSATSIGKIGKKHYWKMGDIPQKKLIVETDTKDGTETWIDKKINSPKEALAFLNPQYLTFWDEHKQKLMTITDTSRAELVQSLANLIKTRPLRSTSFPPEKNTKDLAEVYLYEGKKQAVNLQFNLIKDKAGRVFLNFSGDEIVEYWQLPKDNDILRLLAV